MTKAATTTDERTERIRELIAPFRWEPQSAKLTDHELNELDDFLDACDSQTLSSEKIPSAFWSRVKMPSRCDAAFRTPTNTLALAIALMKTAGDLFLWIGTQSGASDDEIRSALQTLPEEFSTQAGPVFTEHGDASTRIWFGRKVNRLPQLSGSDAIAAVRTLFLIPGADGQRCRVCGCTEEDCRQCIEVTGQPCSWVEIDLCSRCDTESRTSKKAKGANPPESKRKGSKPHIAPPKSFLEEIDIDCIESDPENDRKSFDATELQELAESIKRHGVLQPVLLRPIHGRNNFVIVAGERRWRAAKIAGLKHLPAQISDREGLQVSLARLDENLQRVDLSPIEKAEAMKRLMDSHGLTQKELAESVGVQQGQISNTLRLLNLPSGLRNLVASGKLKPTLIRSVLPYCDLPQVMNALEKRISDSLKADEPIEVRHLDSWIQSAIIATSRSMKYEHAWQPWSDPDPKRRHFAKISEDDLKALNVRKFECLNSWDGQERTFEIEKFDELNRKPLAARREKRKQHKAQKKSDYSTAQSKNAPFHHQWKVSGHIAQSLQKDFVSLIESSKDRATVNRICLAIALMGDLEMTEVIIGPGVHFRSRQSMEKMLDTLNRTPKERDDLIRIAVINALDESHVDLELEEMQACAKLLGRDLSDAWKPDDEFFQLLTDSGRTACASLVNLPTDANPAQLEAAWPAGLIPEFLRPFFGLPEITCSKAPRKKGKAVAA